MKGRFITVEGGEGVGKSTHLEFIRKRLQQRGHEVLATREPGGTPIAEEIRNVVLRLREEPFQPMAELLLMFAARAVHVENLIKPALKGGTWVVCDRFIDATYAYQGGGRGISAQRIAAIERMVLKGLTPDLTLLLDAPFDVGMQRRSARGTQDRFEREQEVFFGRVRRHYLARARREPRRIKVVDASGNIEEVQACIAALLDEKLKRWP